MLRDKRVVVANNNASFRAELVDGRSEVREEGEFWTSRHDIENVAVNVHMLQTVGVQSHKLAEVLLCKSKVFGVVGVDAEAGEKEARCWKDGGEDVDLFKSRPGALVEIEGAVDVKEVGGEVLWQSGTDLVELIDG